MPNPVVHWEIYGKDGPKLHEFYAKLFDWHVDTDNPFDYGFVDTHAEGGINGGIAQAEDGSPSTIVYIQVNDLQSYLDKAEQLGGKIVLPITEIPNVVTLARFSDPNGNIVGLVKE